jgi:two-component system, OmpR family, sensor histidine kinase VicK
MFGINNKNGKSTPKSSVLASDLRNEKAKSDIILNAIDDGVMLLDANKTIQMFNPAAAKITGWAEKDTINLDYHSVIKLVNEKNEPYAQADDPFEKIFEEAIPVRDTKAYLQTNSGKTIAVDINVSALIDQEQNITGAVGIFRDVTQERVEQKQRAEFISTASHEMRTPVAAIEGYLALAMNERVSKIDSKARDYLEKAHESTQHLGKLFQDLLTSAKAEDGRLQNHPSVVEMGDFLQKLSEDVRFVAEKKGLILDYLIGSSGGPTVDITGSGSQKIVRPLYYTYVDPDRLREVITNLFDNAIKYTESGKITIGLTGDDKIVQIRVQDTGGGIPPEDVPHLFEKFYRVDNTATRTIGGTGLGLFISRKIVELYSGRIWVESELGKGSIFFINLPRLSTEKANSLQAQEATKAPNIVSPNAKL